MGVLTRLRAYPAYDSLTDAEHTAVLDASELLDELRPLGYEFALDPAGALKVKAPRGTSPEVRVRVGGLADAVVYVLRAEAAGAAPEDVCRTCGAVVERYSPNSGTPYCLLHYREAWARFVLRMADADQARQASEREAAESDVGDVDPERRAA